MAFWRMRGEVQRPETIAPGRERYEAVCGTALRTSSGEESLGPVELAALWGRLHGVAIEVSVGSR